MKPSKYLIKVLEKRNLAANYWWMRLERPVGFECEAGQYVSLKVTPEGVRRSYSLASWPFDDAQGKPTDYLELVVDVSPMGPGSQFILGLKVGGEVEALGPLGQFVASEERLPKGKQLILVATGCGVVPLRSIVHDLVEEKGWRGEVVLHWGMRFLKYAFWKEEFEELARLHPNFKFDLVLSKPEEGWMGCTGHIQDCLVKHHPDLGGEVAYVCGNREMVEDVVAMMDKKGVKVFHEKFN